MNNVPSVVYKPNKGILSMFELYVHVRTKQSGGQPSGPEDHTLVTSMTLRIPNNSLTYFTTWNIDTCTWMDVTKHG